MEIRSGYGRADKGQTAQGSKAGKMRSAELVSDLFNNQGQKDDDQRPIRVRLSHGSRILKESFQQDLEQLFKESPDLKERFDQVDLGSEEQRGKDLLFRKVQAYMRWMGIREKEGVEEGDESHAFSKISELGKDEELKALMDNMETHRKEIAQARQRQNPNYFYMVYPETYSFN
ncbi:MAG: hypothetical protein CMO81_03940 [Waddliaceae bacterium]|nr:hypothetical protein [Waddliaceae bacterium]